MWATGTNGPRLLVRDGTTYHIALIRRRPVGAWIKDERPLFHTILTLIVRVSKTLRGMRKEQVNQPSLSCKVWDTASLGD